MFSLSCAKKNSLVGEPSLSTSTHKPLLNNSVALGALSVHVCSSWPVLENSTGVMYYCLYLPFS